MRKLILVLVVLVVGTAFKKNEEVKALPTVIDVENSIIKWKGYKPTGSHEGTISLTKGELTINDGKLVEGSVTIGMNTVVVTDIPAGDEYNTKLVGHLKSPDFFDVEKFPTTTFSFTDVKTVEDKLSITGDLTIKGITKEVTILATLTAENEINTLKSDVFTIDRTEFNVQYGSKKFFDNLKDKFINDEFELSFEVKTVK